MNGRTIAKVLIVLVAFPVFAHAIFTAVATVLRLVLSSVQPMGGNSPETVGKAALVAAFLIAVRVSFGVCRRLWPATV